MPITRLFIQSYALCEFLNINNYPIVQFDSAILQMILKYIGLSAVHKPICDLQKNFSLYSHKFN